MESRFPALLMITIDPERYCGCANGNDHPTRLGTQTGSGFAMRGATHPHRLVRVTRCGSCFGLTDLSEHCENCDCRPD